MVIFLNHLASPTSLAGAGEKGEHEKLGRDKEDVYHQHALSDADRDLRPSSDIAQYHA